MICRNTTRQTNLDVLRAIAMLMITIWHFYWGGIGSQSFPDTVTGLINYILSEFLVVCCSVCVNVFVLISSYFLVEKPFNAPRLLNLWLQVVFYSAGLSILFFVVNPGSLSVKELLESFFPISTSQYWFFTIYFGFCCLAPFLSKTALSLSRRNYRILLLVLIFTCCTFTYIIPPGNMMGASKGYTLIWFIALFFWGGYFKRFDIHFGRDHYLLFYFMTALIVTAFCVGKGLLLQNHAGVRRWEIEFPAYNGWAFLLSIPLFLYFKNKTFKEGFLTKMMTALTPFLFGIYLFSEHHQIRVLLWDSPIPWPSYMDRIWFIPFTLGTATVIYFISAGVDFVRALLFRILGVPQKCNSICSNIANRFFMIQNNDSERENT